MARLPRLVIPGLPHLVIHRGHAGADIVVDDEDRAGLLGQVREAAARHGWRLHAWGIERDALSLLLTPASPHALSKAMQELAHRHAVAFNARHRRQGALWAGRFRCAPLQPGRHVLAALCLIERPAVRDDVPAPAHGRSSAAHHLGLVRDPAIVECAEVWQLGNTPFERENALQGLLMEESTDSLQRELEAAVQRGRIAADAQFRQALSARTGLVLVSRPRGRPRRAR